LRLFKQAFNLCDTITNTAACDGVWRKLASDLPTSGGGRANVEPLAQFTASKKRVYHG